MKKIIIGLLFVLFGALMPFAASAQNVVKLAKGQTLGSVMKKAGCHPGWMADIMIDSNLTVADLRKLPIGQEVVLPQNCSQSPEERMAKLSEVILMADTEKGQIQIRREASKLLAERVATLEKDLKTATTERDGIKSELQIIRQELVERARERDGLRDENAKLKASLAEKQIAIKSGEWSFIDQAWLIGAFLIGLGGALLINSYNLQNKQVIDESVIVWKFGKKYVFPVSGKCDLSASGKIVPRHSCPLCGENNLKPRNCEKHLEDAHYAQVYIEDLEAA